MYKYYLLHIVVRSYGNGANHDVEKGQATCVRVNHVFDLFRLILLYFFPTITLSQDKGLETFFPAAYQAATMFCVLLFLGGLCRVGDFEAASLLGFCFMLSGKNIRQSSNVPSN